MQSPDSHDLDIAVSEQIADLKRRLVEAKETIEELRSQVSSSGERFRGDGDMPSEWQWEMGPDLRVNWVSHQIESSIGRPTSFYIGKKIENLGIPYDDPEKWAMHLETLEAHAPFDEFTFWRNTPDGQPRCLTLSARPQFTSEGEFKGYRGTTRDITELQKHEYKLLESEQRYSLAIAGTHDGIWERNFLTGGVHRSPRYLQILGYEPGDLDSSPKAFYDLMPQEDGERCRKAVQAHIETGAPFDIAGEYRARRKSGEHIWISVNAQAEWDEDGKPVRMAGSINNITERKKAEQNLIESESRFKNFADAASDWFWETDDCFRLTWLSMDKLPSSGADSSTIIGHQLWARSGVELEEPRSWNELLDTLLKDKRAFRNFHVRVKFQEFGTRDFSVSGVPVFGDNETFIGYRGAITDVTRQISAEDQLRHSQKMEAVGQLTGGVAHEFNNLLLAVIGNLESLVKQSSVESMREIASSAMESVMRGSKLTRQLLSFSRKQTLNIKSVDINPLMRRTRELLQTTLGPTITINVRSHDGLWPILADEDQLESALMNLSLNARDAMPNGGAITITALNQMRPLLSGNGEKDFVVIEVSDTGHGMTAAVRERAIDPFFTTKDIGSGTGLGLSMVYGFAEQLGGSVEIESKLGKGTQVRIFLPRTFGITEAITTSEPEDNSMQARIENDDNSGIHGNVLFVEDDLMVRKAVSQMLLDLGCNLIEAEDGETASERLNEHPNLDLLFTDVVLPIGISGIDLANNARQRFPNLKILLSSGYPKKGIKGELPKGENIWFLEKPYRADELSRTLVEILGTLNSVPQTESLPRR